MTACLVRLTHPSEIDRSGRSRAGNDVSNVGHTSYVLNEAFEAEAKAGAGALKIRRVLDDEVRQLPDLRRDRPRERVPFQVDALQLRERGQSRRDRPGQR